MQSGTASVTAAAGVPQPSEEELNGRTYLEWLKQWDNDQVAKWLNDNRCGSHATTFATNDIRGNVLLDVDQQALKEMGVQSVCGPATTRFTDQAQASAM
jgi:mitogen-activated protein kinase kinase kinase